MLKTVSYDLAKQLKDCGFPQKTAFYWVITLTQDYHISFYDGELPEVLKQRNDCYAAPLAEEILEELPMKIIVDSKLYWLVFGKQYNGRFFVAYTFRNSKGNYSMAFVENVPHFNNEVLAEAAGLMYCYLKENKLI